MTKLLKRTVDALRPEPNRDIFAWDGELRGFGVRVKPSGVKSYLIQYRNEEGRTRRLVLGQHGPLAPESARILALKKLATVADGKDPSAERRAARAGMTISEICDWYLEEAEAGRLLGRRNRPIKASTLTNDRSRIEAHIKPLLGSRQARALRLADIQGMQSDIAKGKTAKPRVGRGGATKGGPGAAARTVATLQGLLGHARRNDLVAFNPADGVRKLAGKRKDRRLSIAEIKKLGKVMRIAEQEGEHPTALAVVRLLLLTGFRVSEGQGLERAWLRSAAGYVEFPDTKSGGQIRAIGPAAIDLLAKRPARKNCPYVFPADVGDGYFTATAECLARLCAAAEIDNVTPHTLRHTFGSVAGDLGFSELTIAALLGHSAKSVTQSYVHIDEALRLAVTRISEEIAGLLNGSG
jgi:integrase